MLKMMGKKYLQLHAEEFCLSKPLCKLQTTNGPDHEGKYTRTVTLYIRAGTINRNIG